MNRNLDPGTSPAIASPRVPNRSITLAFLLSLALVSCSRGSKPEPWYIEGIQLSQTTLADNPALGMSTDEVRQQLVHALTISKRFVPLAEGKRLKPDLKTLQCRFEVAFTRETAVPGDATRSQAEVGVVLALKRTGYFERFEATGLGRAQFALADAEARRVNFREALGLALQQAIENEAAQLDATSKADDALIADLDSPDVILRDVAVRVLAERKSARAVPALVKRLNDADRELVLRTVGALGEIGDRSAVAPLIEIAQSRDTALMLSLIEVIGTIGGPDAEGYLFTVASGHPDELVRRAATEAQTRARERGRPGESPHTMRTTP